MRISTSHRTTCRGSSRFALRRVRIPLARRYRLVRERTISRARHALGIDHRRVPRMTCDLLEVPPVDAIDGRVLLEPEDDIRALELRRGLSVDVAPRRRAGRSVMEDAAALGEPCAEVALREMLVLFDAAEESVEATRAFGFSVGRVGVRMERP